MDATGRATLSPRWLAELGFSVPVESQQIRLAYASRPYRRHGQDLGGRLGTASWAYPGHPYGGFVFAEEGDRCIMMVAAYSGGPLAIDDAGLLNVTQQLPTDVLSQLVRTGRPLGPAALMRFPAERRHRFDRAGRLPAGFLPIGDAICSFNPSYGQGMTVLSMNVAGVVCVYSSNTVPLGPEVGIDER